MRPRFPAIGLDRHRRLMVAVAFAAIAFASWHGVAPRVAAPTAVAAPAGALREAVSPAPMTMEPFRPRHALRWPSSVQASFTPAVTMDAELAAWAETDPRAALAWICLQPGLDAPRAFSTVFRAARMGAGELADEARRVADLHPTLAQPIRRQAVAALADRNEWATAVGLAGDNAAERSDLLALGYGRWARVDGESALLDALEMADASARHVALATVISAWAKTSPDRLLALVGEFPEGPERELALVTGLRHYLAADPDAALAWIQRHGPGIRQIERALDY